jgi:probable rRNA maturation factor
MEINVLIEEEFSGCPSEGWLQDIVRHILNAQKVGQDTELSLLITGQEQIRELNRDYRDKDEPTDVLSFCLTADDEHTGTDSASFITAPDGVRHLGEVIISCPQAIVQAGEHRHSVEKEMAILIIHGVLHLLGYDHEETEMESQMSAREAAILADIQQEIDSSLLK